MRGSIAQGLAMVLLIAGSGAAQGPTSSGSANTRNAKSLPASAAGAKSKAKPTHPFQVGTASWYGEYFDGKPTASGEPYNMYDLTAAHPALPLGSYVRVTNLRNRKSVVVRINDRGPIVPGRIIDLSFGAAHALQMNKAGLQRVRLDIIRPEVVAELHTPVAY
jgi:rare lipoprotein A